MPGGRLPFCVGIFKNLASISSTFYERVFCAKVLFYQKVTREKHFHTKNAGIIGWWIWHFMKTVVACRGHAKIKMKKFAWHKLLRRQSSKNTKQWILLFISLTLSMIRYKFNCVSRHLGYYGLCNNSKKYVTLFGSLNLSMSTKALRYNFSFGNSLLKQLQNLTIVIEFSLAKVISSFTNFWGVCNWIF